MTERKELWEFFSFPAPAKRKRMPAWVIVIILTGATALTVIAHLI